MSDIRMVVLDTAGTTVRDPGVVEAAARAAVMHTAGTLPDTFDAAFGKARGASKRDMLASILNDEGLANRAHDYFERDLLERVAGGALQPLPAAQETIQQFKDNGLLVALTTGFSRPVREALLHVLGWQELVDLALSPEDAGRGRPYPDMVLTALLRLRVDDVRHVAVVGDTANDLLAGTRAGAAVVVGVLTGAHDRRRLERAPHTHIVASVADLAAIVWSRKHNTGSARSR
jgi:phosphonatase-like hydrolase